MNAARFNETITLSHQESAEDSHVFSMIIHPESDVFKGHFPETPVLPGVCMLAAVKRGLHLILNRDIHLQSANAIKFLAMITPDKTPQATLKITAQADGDTQKVSAEISAGEHVFFKLKGIYQ